MNDISTPALLLDLDCVEHNMHIMGDYLVGRRAKLRPHFKSHQVLALSAKQVEAGAIGITCGRLDHAAALVEHGIQSVLLASEFAGENALRRFVDLCRRSTILCVVDNAKIVSDIARLAGDNVSRINVLVDVNVGLNRCGVPPGEPALALTRVVLEKGLSFRGLMGYAGTVKLPPGAERDEAARLRLRPLIETKSLIKSAGVHVEMVSCGGTSDYVTVSAAPDVTEIQAGSYLLMDTDYAPIAPEFHPALSVLATVVSVTPDARIVVDAGMKAISCDKGLPRLKGSPGLRLTTLHAEHGIIDIVHPSSRVEVGDKVEVMVRYLDATVQLHTYMYGVRSRWVKDRMTIEH